MQLFVHAVYPNSHDLFKLLKSPLILYLRYSVVGASM
jgi:hypothetical protein